MTLHQLHMTYTYNDGMYKISLHIPEADVEDIRDTKAVDAIDGLGSDQKSFAETLCDLADVVYEIEKRNDNRKDGDGEGTAED